MSFRDLGRELLDEMYPTKKKGPIELATLNYLLDNVFFEDRDIPTEEISEAIGVLTRRVQENLRRLKSLNILTYEKVGIDYYKYIYRIKITDEANDIFREKVLKG